MVKNLKEMLQLPIHFESRVTGLARDMEYSRRGVDIRNALSNNCECTEYDSGDDNDGAPRIVSRTWRKE